MVTLRRKRFVFWEETESGHVKVTSEQQAISAAGAIIQNNLYPYVWPDDWQFKPKWGKPELNYATAALDVFKFYGTREGWKEAKEYCNGMDEVTYRITEYHGDGTVTIYPEKEITNELEANNRMGRG